MSKIPKTKWTKLEKEFDELVNMCESVDQMTRISGRLQLNTFVEKHGQEKCDQMWKRIQ